MHLYNSIFKNQKLNVVIAFFSQVLLLTNIWIIIYRSLLDYLNYKFSPNLIATFFRKEAVFPEPFDIPLYLILTFIFVLFLKYFQSGLRYIKGYLVERPFQNYGLFLFLLIIFTSKLGPYPLAGDLFIYPERQDKVIYYLILLLYLCFISFILIQFQLLKKIVNNSSKLKYCIAFYIVTLIALLTFKPGFPIAPLDQTFFIGPIWDIVKGKTIYTDILSRYGFLSVLSFALFVKLRLLDIFSLPIIIWVLYIIQYSLCFYLIYKVSNSLTLSILCLFSILTINFYTEYHAPQSGPMRWLPIFFAIFLFYRLRKIDSKIFIFLLIPLSLWFIDSGIVIVFGYLFSLFIFLLFKQISINRAIKTGFFFLFSLIITLIAINAIHLLLGMKSINYFRMFQSLKEFGGSGFSMIPIPSNTYFWLFLLVYLASVLFFISQPRPNSYPPSSNNLGILLFSANLSFFASIYFVGRSIDHNLFAIGIFLIFNLFLLLGIKFNSIKLVRLRFSIYLILFTLLIAYPAFAKKELLVESILQRVSNIKTGNVFKPKAKEILLQKYGAEISLLKDFFRKDEKITIISNDDTYLLALLDKKGLIDANPLDIINTPSELNRSLEKVFQFCPKRIVLDCFLKNKCSDHQSFSRAWPGTLAEILNSLEKTCGIYAVKTCTNQLCIGEVGIKQ